jgi:hypothetical protein
MKLYNAFTYTLLAVVALLACYYVYVDRQAHALAICELRNTTATCMQQLYR